MKMKVLVSQNLHVTEKQAIYVESAVVPHEAPSVYLYFIILYKNPVM